MSKKSGEFDWKAGVWREPAAVRADTRICITGDWAPIRQFEYLIDRDPSAVYGDLLPTLQGADLNITNMEAPLSDRGAPVAKSGSVFKGRSRHIKGLQAAPFHAVTLANNHQFDYGLDAFEDTLDILDANGIRRTGAGRCPAEASEPLYMRLPNLELAVVNFSEGEDMTAAVDGAGVAGWDIAAAEERVREARSRADFVIVVAHCGVEYIPYPPVYVVEAFRRVAEAGADLVIGHHPHVPQGIAFHNDVPICYSLGNFVFYQQTALKYRKLGYMVEVEIGEGRLAGLKPVPYRIGENGLSLLGGRERGDFLEGLRELSEPLASPAEVAAGWHGFLAYLGEDGFRGEVARILETMRSEPAKGAAMFRNRLTTPQHFEHWRDLMTYLIRGDLYTAPAWAVDRVREYLTAEI